MNIENINSLLRTVMTLLGAFLVGGGMKFFGMELSEGYWAEIVGVVLAIVAVVWSIRSKIVEIEKLQGLIRQIVTFICGILLAKGILNDRTMEAVIAFAGAIIPFIQAGVARVKNQQINTGVINPVTLKGANDKSSPVYDTVIKGGVINKI